MNLGDTIGTIAPGFEADIVAVPGIHLQTSPHFGASAS